MSCTPSSSKQTRNIRNLDSAKRIERPLDYISQQATTGKTPVKRKRLVKVRVSIQYQTSIVCWLIGTSRHATHATRVSVDVMAWVRLIYFLYLLSPSALTINSFFCLSIAPCDNWQVNSIPTMSLESSSRS